MEIIWGWVKYSWKVIGITIATAAILNYLRIVFKKAIKPEIFGNGFVNPAQERPAAHHG